MYDPTIGRFLSRDPLGFADGPNDYAYVRNSPTNYLDPTGTAAVVFVQNKPVFGGGFNVGPGRADSTNEWGQPAKYAQGTYSASGNAASSSVWLTRGWACNSIAGPNGTNLPGGGFSALLVDADPGDYRIILHVTDEVSIKPNLNSKLTATERGQANASAVASFNVPGKPYILNTRVEGLSTRPSEMAQLRLTWNSPQPPPVSRAGSAEVYIDVRVPAGGANQKFVIAVFAPNLIAGNCFRGITRSTGTIEVESIRILAPVDVPSQPGKP